MKLEVRVSNQINSKFLKEDQQKLYNLLKGISKKYNLHEIYIGCSIALDQKENPDRIPQAAYSLRELIDLLPDNETGINPQGDEPTQSLLEAVRELRDDFNRACENSVAHQSSKWIGEIDTALQRYIRKSKEFFGRFESINPSKEKLFESFLWQRIKIVDRELSIKIPPIFWKRTIDPVMDKWKIYRKKLNSILHHKKFVRELDTLISDLEQFLDYCLNPKPSISRRKTFTDIEEIERLIRIGETGDKK